MCGVSDVLQHIPLHYAEGQLQFRCVCWNVYISYFLLLQNFEKNAISNSGSEGK